MNNVLTRYIILLCIASSIIDRQSFEWTSRVDHETQIITLENWTRTDAVHASFSLDLTCNTSSCDGYQFCFRFAQMTTGIL